MPKKKYLTKRDNLGTISPWDIDGNLSDIAKMLEGIRDEWLAKGYTEVGMEPDGDTDTTYFSLYGLRQETDKERDTRLDKVRKAREAAAEKRKKKESGELKELERLLSKHGDKLKGLLK